MLQLAADENFNNDIVRGLKRRDPLLDIVRTQDAGLSGATDPELLAWAAREGRALLTAETMMLVSRTTRLVNPSVIGLHAGPYGQRRSRRQLPPWKIDRCPGPWRNPITFAATPVPGPVRATLERIPPLTRLGRGPSPPEPLSALPVIQSSTSSNSPAVSEQSSPRMGSGSICSTDGITPPDGELKSPLRSR